jgi:predicted phage terminase large subunit-like protein
MVATLAKPTLAGLRAHRAKSSMLGFVQYMRPDYMVGLHHKAICKKLDDFKAGKIKRLMIFVPPQHGKSELSSRYLPAYLLGHNPDLKIALASYSPDLASAFNSDCQRIIDNATFRTLFPKTTLSGAGDYWGGKLKGYKRNTEIFEVVGHRGSFKSVGIRTALTGSTVDVGIIDDPVKDRVEAENPETQEAIWQWYTNVFLSRLNNKSQQLILLTRWHENDLAGRLLAVDAKRVKEGKPARWEVISFPAIKEGAPTELDPRQPGEALWPEMHDLTNLMEKKESSDTRTWESLYQQQPTSKSGNIIKTDKFRFMEWDDFIALSRNKSVMWNYKLDGAYTEKKDRDASALFAEWFDEDTQTLYVRKSESVRMEFPALCAYVPEFLNANGYGWASRLKVEPKANGLSIIQSLRNETGLNVEAYEFPFIDGYGHMAQASKKERAIAVSPKVDAGRVVLIKGEWNESFIAQCKAFPLGKHDDEVDCLIMALLEYFFANTVFGVSNGN